MAEKKPFILLVEDETAIASVLLDYMVASGFEASHIADGAAALEAVDKLQPDLVVLDVMLPGMDGLEILRNIRRDSDLPVIMLTARVEEIDRLLGLEQGADDYICKPFSPREVVARVKAVMRRFRIGGTAPPEAAPDAPIILDDDAMTARVLGHRLDLTPTEFRLLKVMFKRPGRVFSRAQLLDLTHDDEAEVFDRVIDSHIKNLRRKIGDHLPEQTVIHSVYGVGYRYELDEQTAP